jgi:stearoyl-CoA desaturase (delta-9 desaturase)
MTRGFRWPRPRDWFITPSSPTSNSTATLTTEIDWARSVPFIFMHVACFSLFWVGWSWIAIGAAAGLYVSRMLVIAAFYHRYFSHRSFKTSRWCQFAFAVLGCAAAQKGPLWWAAHHRHHHQHSDRSEDIHSPYKYGFWWSHVGWVLSKRYFHTDISTVKDFAKYPELVFLDRFDLLVPAVLGMALYTLGSVLRFAVPSLNTSGPQLLVWGFFVSTVFLFHGTSTINSLSHLIGRQRYETGDQSRNCFVLALITFGEWHNNHHYYPISAKQGFRWWEIDFTYAGLTLFSWLGLIWDVKIVPTQVVSPAGSINTPSSL